MNRLTADDTLSIIFKINTLAVLVFILLSGQAFAEQPKEKSSERMAFFEMHYAKGRDICNFSEFGSKLKNNYFEYQGKKSDSNDYCEVKINKTEFSNHFRYCGLASYNLKYNKFGACSFSESKDSYVFSAGVPNNEHGAVHNCSFVCLTKTDGNKSR